MDLLTGILTHAQYNQWMNQRLYDASERLSDAERSADQAAFFGSIVGTLNHLIVGDSIWLRRFFLADIAANRMLGEAAQAWLPQPSQLDQIIYPDWDKLRDMRSQIDTLLIDWTNALQREDLDTILHYQNTKGRPFKRSLGLLLLHFFNHQTHHRGQASTLLFQNGVDPGITDMLAILPSHD